MNVNQDKIYNYLLDGIMTGKLALRERIPTEIELSKIFGTTRMNAHRAIKELERFGVLRRNKRQGTFIHKIPTSITTGELKSINTRRICVLNHNSPVISKIHWNKRIISTLKGAIQKNNIDMVFKDISHLNFQEEFCDFIKNIAEEGYNSLIIVGDDFVNSIISEHPEVLFEFHNNVFIFDRGTDPWHDWPYNVVSVNLFGEGVIAAEYLLQKGYEKIVYAKGSYISYWAEERERGLQFGLMRASDKKNQADIFVASEMQEVKVLDKLKNTNKKCAIVAQNDDIASRIFEEATKRKLSPGIDFGLLGFDDNAKFRQLNLTTISPPLEKIGSRLAELVTQKLDGKKDGEIATIRIDSELIVRKTC